MYSSSSSTSQPGKISSSGCSSIYFSSSCSSFPITSSSKIGFSSSKPGSSSSSNPGRIVSSSSLSSLSTVSSNPGNNISSSSAFTSSGSGFFLGLPLLFLTSSVFSSASCTILVFSSFSSIFVSSTWTFLGLPLLFFTSWVCFFCISSGLISSFISAVFSGSSTFWTFLIVLALGIITGFVNFFSPLGIDSTFIPSLLTVLLTLFFNFVLFLLWYCPYFWVVGFSYDVSCWYLGLLASNTAFTFIGKNFIINFNCLSVYCEAILSKLSTYLSSFLPKRL